MTNTYSHPIVPAGPFNMELSYVSKLEDGDLITVDPLFGMEQIILIDTIETNGVGPAKRLLLRYALVGGETNTRNVLRFPHEPVTRWTAVL